jgi:hypothetical protein
MCFDLHLQTAFDGWCMESPCLKAVAYRCHSRDVYSDCHIIANALTHYYAMSLLEPSRNDARRAAI